MEIDIIGLLCAFSYALDCVESELLNVSTGHGKRVAYMSVCIAKKFNINSDDLQDLVAYALLHDNALTQYIAEEYNNDLAKADVNNLTDKQFGQHCILGEENIKKYPFRTAIADVILYHHENANGTGPFKKKADEVHLFARIIHLCDILDKYSKFGTPIENRFEKAKKYLLDHKDTLFDSDIVNAFLEVFDKEKFEMLNTNDFDELLWNEIPRKKQYYSYEVLKGLTDLFAKITDYKSSFTSKHSIGVAEKSSKLAKFMGYDNDTVQKMYIAGALHDIGKIAINNDILEKPSRLTNDEFANMKNHAWWTYVLLSQVDGFEEITKWAANHHEKLDGSGYPFGKTEKELSEQERILACVDIYQALTEPRPYKDGMSHEKACEIMEDMVAKHWIDGKIVEKIKECFKK